VSKYGLLAYIKQYFLVFYGYIVIVLAAKEKLFGPELF
jgi:hypothetical protein